MLLILKALLTFFRIEKKSLKVENVFQDNAPTAFYDALHFTEGGTAYAFSDTDESLNLKLAQMGKVKWGVS